MCDEYIDSGRDLGPDCSCFTFAMKLICTDMIWRNVVDAMRVLKVCRLPNEFRCPWRTVDDVITALDADCMLLVD